MNKSIYIIVVIGIVIIGAILLKDKPITNSEIRIGYSAQSLGSSAIVVASEGGYFKKHDLEVMMVPMKGGAEVRLALIYGHIDIGSAGMVDFIPIIASGVPARVITPMSLSATYIFVRPDSNINSFRDLYGKTVSVSPGGSDDVPFRVAMDKDNIDVSKINFIDIEGPYRVSTLMQRKLSDAAIVGAQDASRFIEEGAIVLPEWENSQHFKQLQPRTSILVTTAYLNENQDLLDKFFDAYGEAHALIKNDPFAAAILVSEDIIEQTNGAVDYSPDTIVSEWNSSVINTVWQDPKIGMEMVKKSKELGITDKDLSLEDIYDLRFADKLKKLQEEIYGGQN